MQGFHQSPVRVRRRYSSKISIDARGSLSASVGQSAHRCRETWGFLNDLLDAGREVADLLRARALRSKRKRRHAAPRPRISSQRVHQSRPQSSRACFDRVDNHSSLAGSLQSMYVLGHSRPSVVDRASDLTAEHAPPSPLKSIDVVSATENACTYMRAIGARRQPPCIGYSSAADSLEGLTALPRPDCAAPSGGQLPLGSVASNCL